MSYAKLRRSRDVSERDPIKIEFTFKIRDLGTQARALVVRREGHEYVHQVTDLIAKSQLTGPQHRRQSLYILSGGHSTACPASRVSSL
jgi:hypothetical protein